MMPRPYVRSSRGTGANVPAFTYPRVLGLLLCGVMFSASGCTGLRQWLGKPVSTAGVDTDPSAPATRGQRGAQGVPQAGPVPDPIVAEPADPEPEPNASDSAGVARLVRLAQVWHTVSLHHPWVATRGVPWDSALIVAATRVRFAVNDSSLTVAYFKLLSLLRDPLSRVEPTTLTVPVPVPVVAELRADSAVVIRIAPSAALDVNDSALVAQVIANESSRVLLDLRGAPVPDPLAQSARLEAFLVRTGAVARLVKGSVAAPVQRTRRVGVWPAHLAAEAQAAMFRDGWDQPGSRIITGSAATQPRIVIVADSGTVLPDVLIALQSNVSAFLVADGPLRDAVPVNRVRIPLNDRLVVTVRTGELVQSDGSVDILPDTMITRSAMTPRGFDTALQVGLSLLRSNTRWPYALRALPVHRTPAITPVFYDTTSYPYMGARLLGGFRIWSAMRARHAHRDLYDDDIDAVFERVIPRLESATTDIRYAKALAELAASLNDVEARPQGASYEAMIGVASLPFRVRSAEGRVFITDVVPDAVTTSLGLTRGVEVLAVDGYPVVSWFYEHQRVAPASNEWSRMNSMLHQMPRGPEVDVMVKLRDLNNREHTVQIPRRQSFRAALPVRERPGTVPVHMLSSSIAYVDVEQLTPATAAAAIRTIFSARGVVLDLRGRLTIDDTLLLPSLATRVDAVIARVIQRSIAEPCVASLRNAAVECADVRETRMWPWNRDTVPVLPGSARPRIVALIDERTQGAMERLAMTLDQIAVVTFVGSPSAGSVSWTTPLSLPGGLTVGIATQELRSADGGQIQRVGLTPLVEARPSVRGIKAGEDEVLSRAQQWLQQQLDPPTRRRR